MQLNWLFARLRLLCLRRWKAYMFKSQRGHMLYDAYLCIHYNPSTELIHRPGKFRITALFREKSPASKAFFLEDVFFSGHIRVNKMNSYSCRGLHARWLPSKQRFISQSRSTNLKGMRKLNEKPILIVRKLLIVYFFSFILFSVKTTRAWVPNFE